MDVKKEATEFIRKYNIKKLTYSRISEIIELQGYKIIEFGEWQNSSVAKIIKACHAENQADNKECFSRCDKKRKIVFIKDNTSDDQRLVLLSHEEAHIFLKHNTVNNEIVDALQEDEANEFSYHIRKYDGNKINRNRNIIAIVVAVVLFLGLLTIPIIKSIANKNTPTTTNNSAGISASTVTTANDNTHTVLDTTPNITKSLNPNEQVFITETGKKFHREDCQYIKDKTNLKIYIIKEAEELGYSACEKCFE